jgi:hypothetical protein
VSKRHLTTATAVAVIAALAVAAVVASAGSGTDEARIRGAVFLGPLCGGEPRGGGEPPRSCSRNYRPLRAPIRFVRLDQRMRSRRVRSGADGRFEIELPAGVYRLDPLPARGSSGAQPPRELTLAPGEVRDVIVDYDAGKR